LFERTEAAISFGFASMQRALVDLQLQVQIKLRKLRDQQEDILQTQSPSADAYAEFRENVKKIDRSLESFTAHADNISHIKLTLARAAAFVSAEGNLAQLVQAKVLILFFCFLVVVSNKCM
jgi:septation ring formation regulator EzrA